LGVCAYGIKVGRFYYLLHVSGVRPSSGRKLHCWQQRILLNAMDNSDSFLLLVAVAALTAVLFYLPVDVFSLGCIMDAVGSRLPLHAADSHSRGVWFDSWPGHR
jgi:hypothetical protein